MTRHIHPFNTINKLPGFWLVIVGFFAVCANPSGFYFLNDDFVHIPLAAEGNFRHGNLLRPVADISLWADGKLYGKNATGFHLTNIVIHFINTILVYFLYKRFLMARGVLPGIRPTLASGLFLIYAFHSESVFWIIGRGGSLASLFILLSLNCFLYSRSLLSLWIALCSFVLGLFTYEFTWILPLLVVVLGLSQPGVKRRDFLIWSAGFLMLFAAYLLVRFYLTESYFGKYEAGLIREASFGKLSYNYIATVARSFLPPVNNSSAFLVVFVSFMLVVTSVILIKRKSKMASIVALMTGILISCLPSISLGIDTHDQEGERFLYLSSVFCCLFLIEFVFLFISSEVGKIAVLAVIFVVHAYYFYLSSRSYRFASGIVKQSLECLANAGHARELGVVNLPSQYRGALIFRKGFVNAVEWFFPGQFGLVKIHSSMELLKETPVQCINKTVAQGTGKTTLRFDREGNVHIE